MLSSGRECDFDFGNLTGSLQSRFAPSQKRRFYGFTDVLQRFLPGSTLRHTSRKRGTLGHNPSVFPGD